MEAVFVPLALVAGALLAVQVGANTWLSKAAGGADSAWGLVLGYSVRGWVMDHLQK